MFKQALKFKFFYLLTIFYENFFSLLTLLVQKGIHYTLYRLVDQNLKLRFQVRPTLLWSCGSGFPNPNGNKSGSNLDPKHLLDLADTLNFDKKVFVPGGAERMLYSPFFYDQNEKGELLIHNHM